MRPGVLGAWAGALALVACAGRAPVPAAPPAAPPLPPSASEPAPPAESGPRRYDCGEASFTLRIDGDFAVLEGLADGPQRLGRDAGGTKPQEAVYANTVLRAEFGLGPDARDAMLQYLQPLRTLHCRQG